MFCKHCGKEIDDRASVCIHCGISTSAGNMGFNQFSQEGCPHCGYEGKLNSGPLLRVMDWLIGLLTIWFGFGVLYFIIILIIRSDESKREKICPRCGKQIK